MREMARMARARIPQSKEGVLEKNELIQETSPSSVVEYQIPK